MTKTRDQLGLLAPTGGRNSRTRKPKRGRPKKSGAGVPHLPRAPFSARHPLHVTLRVSRGVYNLRSRRFFRVFERALSFERDRTASATPGPGATALPGTLRIVHYAVLGNHMHLIVEAPDQVTLSRRIQGLEIRLAKNFNRVMNARRGRVFADRYHARALKTPLEVRRAIVYVLGNAARHFPLSRPAPGTRGSPLTAEIAWRRGLVIDRYASGQWFDGWASPACSVTKSANGAVLTNRSPPGRDDSPVLSAQTWLLGLGWKRHGLIAPSEVWR